MKKGYLEMSFTWLFAIIVGGFILFLAIYAVITLKPTEDLERDVKLSKKIGILLNPLETGFETSKIAYLKLPAETRIYNKCHIEKIFGTQIIQTSQKNFNKFSEPSLEVEFANKYIFSEKAIEDKNFAVILKRFEFPFKVADLIYIIPESEEYCFIDAPEEIKEEIKDNFKLKNIAVGEENCGEESKKVCFEDSNCDINVYEQTQLVEKNGKTVFFEGDALMYAAIFSEEDIYECQLKRLMQRVEQLALLYEGKASFISQTAGCSTNLNLRGLSISASGFENSNNLNGLVSISENIENEHNLGRCKLW